METNEEINSVNIVNANQGALFQSLCVAERLDARHVCCSSTSLTR
jgi:hypothetical protein